MRVWRFLAKSRGRRRFRVWRRIRSRDPGVAHKRRLETVVTKQAWRSEERQDLQQATVTFVTLWQSDRRCSAVGMKTRHAWGKHDKAFLRRLRGAVERAAAISEGPMMDYF